MNIIDKMREEEGWGDWMQNWVEMRTIPSNNCDSVEVVFCYHPDYEVFLVTSDPEEAVKGFHKFIYRG